MRWSSAPASRLARENFNSATASASAVANSIASDGSSAYTVEPSASPVDTRISQSAGQTAPPIKPEKDERGDGTTVHGDQNKGIYIENQNFYGNDNADAVNP